MLVQLLAAGGEHINTCSSHAKGLSVWVGENIDQLPQYCTVNNGVADQVKSLGPGKDQ